jgi:Icc-related predicted phosphoesterase
MRVCHFSDMHGNFRQLPAADLYICTGDALQNFPLAPGTRHPQLRRDGTVRFWTIDKDVEAAEQTRWLTTFLLDGGFRRYLASPDAPIVCVRGNHDFVDLARLFEGCNLVHEFIDSEGIDLEVAGETVRIAGHRGIPYIFGSWNDEESRADLKDRFRRMPLADIYLTHFPPAGILDSEMPSGHGESYGLEGVVDALTYRVQRALHCFGHIHECGGRTKKVGDVTFSNAATTHNVIEW